MPYELIKNTECELIYFNTSFNFISSFHILGRPDMVNASTVRFEFLSFFTIRITWERPNDNFNEINEYELELILPPGIPSSFPTVPVFELDTPQPNFNYAINITACNDVGCGDVSETVEFTSITPGLSVYPSICLSVCLFVCVCLSIYLHVYLLFCLLVSLSVSLSVCLSVCLSVYLSVCLSVCLSICCSVYWSLYLSVSLSVCLSICLHLSVCLPICHFCFTICLCLSVCVPAPGNILLVCYNYVYLSVYLFIPTCTFISIYPSVPLSHLISFCSF